MLLNRKKALASLALLVFFTILVEANSLRSQFQSEISIRYNSENMVVRGKLQYDGSNMQVDYYIPNNLNSETVVSHFYSQGYTYEVLDSVCTRYNQQELPFPMNIPETAVFTETYSEEGIPMNAWTSQIEEDRTTKTVRWLKDQNDVLKMIQIISPWGLERSIIFESVSELSHQLNEPSTYGVCSRIIERETALSTSCEGSCSYRGICIASTCYCFNDFAGSDCSSIPKDTKPGVCGNGILEENEECDDGNVVNDDCCNNLCKVNTHMISTECLSGQSCKMPIGVCSSQGVCVSDNDPNGFCSDNNECTVDQCIDGVCVSSPRELTCSDLPQPYRECSEAYGCDPKTGSCLFKPVDDGTKCQGSSACSGVCMGGKCVDDPVSCNSNMVCQESFCDLENGQCVNKPSQEDRKSVV